MLAKISRNRVRVTKRSQSGSIAQDPAIRGFVRSTLDHPLDSIELSVKATNYPVTGRVFVNKYHPDREGQLTVSVRRRGYVRSCLDDPL